MATGNVSTPHTLVSAEQPWVGTKFSVLDSDIEVQSSDGFIFQLHRRVLDVGTGAFPGSEIDTHGEVVHLDESAQVLSILFAFCYPKKFVELERESFKVVLDVAKAAEKYEVFGAMFGCCARLRELIPQHAAEVFNFAIEHDYPKLINEAVQYLARAPFIPTLAKFPPAYVVPWARYCEAWSLVFKGALQEIIKLPVESSRCHASSPWGGRRTGDDSICSTCQRAAFTLIARLEQIDSMVELEEALKSPGAKYADLKCCNNEEYPREPCAHVDNIAKFCRNGAKMVPDFLRFVNGEA